MKRLRALNDRVDLKTVFAGALLVGLLATGACSGARPAPKEVIGTALCERYDARGTVVQSGPPCPPLATATAGR